MSQFLNPGDAPLLTTADPLPTPEEDLLRLLGEWRRLTENETRAIRLADWKDIAVQQQRKVQLQHAITAVLHRKQVSPVAAENALQSPALRLAVSELTLLELRNRELLGSKCAVQKAELDRIHGTTRRFKDLRRAYGGSSSPVWQSYS